MFIRLMREDERKEVLYNTSHISKIEVTYGEIGPEPHGSGELTSFTVELKSGQENPAAVRSYDVYILGEVLHFASNSDNPVVQVIEKIYKDAVKG